LQIEKPVAMGCPQVSCSGPGFWNILYSWLFNMDFTHRTSVIAFADVLMVLTRGKCTLDAENYTNQDLKKITNWARENKMNFNGNKSEVLLVTTKTSGANRTLNIYLNNKSLEQVSELKHIGIYLDNRFSFDRHVDYITGKCIPIINMLAKSAKLNCGLGHRALKVIYTGAIEPILTYEAPMWEKALKQNNLRKYQRVQRMMSIKIRVSNAFRTLPYETSCLLAGVRPIRLAVEEKVRTYKATHNNTVYDAPLEVRHWPQPAEIPLIRVPTEIPRNVINIFKDGSKIGGKVRAAAVIIKDDIALHQAKYNTHERCSNNQAEQVAILRALEQIQNLQLAEGAEKIAVVNTDSKVTVDTLQNRNKHYILIENIRKGIKRLEDLRWSLVFKW